MFTIGEIIDLAIRIERNGEEIYRKAARAVSVPTLASLLVWLADQELEHEKWFVELKHTVANTVEAPALEEMGKKILQTVLGDEAFSIKNADFSWMEDTNHLLSLALEFEKDTILFYEMLAAFVDDAQLHQQLEKIIEEERRHVGNLEQFLETGQLPEGVHAA
jgi:rubrerythrin